MAHHLETADELAVMGPVLQQKDLVKKDQCNTECVKLEFPGLVLCVELFGNIARLAVIGTGKITSNILDVLAVSGPSIAIVKHVVSAGCQSQGSARVILTRTQWGCEEILVPRGSR